MRWLREVWVLTGNAPALVLPRGCAACGIATERSRLLAGPASTELLVPYCGPCLERLVHHDTLAVAANVASLLLAACWACVFPLLWPDASLGLHLTVTLLAALSAQLLRSPASKLFGFESARPSVSFHAGRLLCERQAFAGEVAALNALGVRPERIWIGAGERATWLLAPLLGLALATGMYRWQHLPLRVLNVGAEPLWLVVDGRTRGRILPSPVEAGTAGIELSVPRGAHRLAAVDEVGRSLAEVDVVLSSPHGHLFAPKSETHCFWLELTGYGRERGRRTIPMVSTSRFWVLGEAVDTWFVPSPAAAGADERSTGGVLTALRYAPCADAPTIVATASAAGP
jgi:hypothetical protein